MECNNIRSRTERSSAIQNIHNHKLSNNNVLSLETVAFLRGRRNSKTLQFWRRLKWPIVKWQNEQKVFFVHSLRWIFWSKLNRLHRHLDLIILYPRIWDSKIVVHKTINRFFWGVFCKMGTWVTMREGFLVFVICCQNVNTQNCDTVKLCRTKRKWTQNQMCKMPFCGCQANVHLFIYRKWLIAHLSNVLRLCNFIIHAIRAK